MFHAID